MNDKLSAEELEHWNAWLTKDAPKVFAQYVATIEDLQAQVAVLTRVCEPFKQFADKRPFGSGALCIPQDVELNMGHMRQLQDACANLPAAATALLRRYAQIDESCINMSDELEKQRQRANRAEADRDHWKARAEKAEEKLPETSKLALSFEGEARQNLERAIKAEANQRTPGTVEVCRKRMLYIRNPTRVTEIFDCGEHSHLCMVEDCPIRAQEHER